MDEIPNIPKSPKLLEEMVLALDTELPRAKMIKHLVLASMYKCNQKIDEGINGEVYSTVIKRAAEDVCERLADITEDPYEGVIVIHYLLSRLIREMDNDIRKQCTEDIELAELTERLDMKILNIL